MYITPERRGELATTGKHTHKTKLFFYQAVLSCLVLSGVLMSSVWLVLLQGHSANFIMMVDLPFYTNPGASVDIAEDHFVKRGVAILCQLDD